MKTLLSGKVNNNGKQFTTSLQNNINKDDIHKMLPSIYNGTYT